MLTRSVAVSVLMTQQNIQTVGNTSERIKIALAVVSALAGAAAFQVLSNQPLPLRLLAVLVGVVVALALLWFSTTGQRFIGFARESVAETKRVVWPTRKEGVQMTGIIFGFVVIMAIYLLIVDKSLEWVLYDLLLGWKR